MNQIVSDNSERTLERLDELETSNVKCLKDGTLMKIYFTGNGPDDSISHLICPVCHTVEDE